MTETTTAAAPPQNPQQSVKPEVQLAKTIEFFDRVSSKKIGDVCGAAQLREQGVLLHPGTNNATEATFAVGRNLGLTTFAAWIGELPPEALANPDAGVAAVEFFLDGRPAGRVVVDRHTNSYHTFDLANVSELKIVVDNGNGQSLYDWLFLGVM
jgi:hypothetical protein